MKLQELFPPDLAGYAAQDAIKVLLKNWKDALRDGVKVEVLLTDVNDVETLLEDFKYKIQADPTILQKLE